MSGAAATSGPWEDYASPAASDGPWADYAPVAPKVAPQKVSPSPKPVPVTAKGLAKAGGSGLLSGVAGIADTIPFTPAGASNMVKQGGALGNFAARKLGLETQDQSDRNNAALTKFRTSTIGPTAGEVQQGAGLYHAPQNEPERYAAALGAFAPNLLMGPEGIAKEGALALASRVGRQVVAPAVGSETARYGVEKAGGGQIAQGIASVAGGVTGGALGSVRGLPRPELGGVTKAIGGALSAIAPKSTDVQTLHDAGVFLTPGQRLGGMAKNAEDLAMRAPILGNAVSGARNRGVVSLNRAVANRALEPIGDALPPEIKPGHAAVDYVATRLGKEYDNAAAMVPEVRADADFHAAMQKIGKDISEQPPSVAEQFGKIIENNVTPFIGDEPITGAKLREIQSTIGQKAAGLQSSDAHDQRELGYALEDVSDELKNLLGRTNPEAGAKIAAANEGWANYVRLRNAASKAPKGGIFSPNQLSTAVRASDKSVGKGNVAKGQALMQDLSGAASTVMPDAFGNPGTANTLLGSGLATDILFHPASGVPAAGALAVAATPYFLMGRNVVRMLPARATQAELKAAAARLEQLASKDPAVIPLYRQIAHRAATGGALSGALALSASQAHAQDQRSRP